MLCLLLTLTLVPTTFGAPRLDCVFPLHDAGFLYLSRLTWEEIEL